MRNVLRAIDRAMYFTVSMSVVTVLVTMVLLGFVQVVIRNFFQTGIPWAEVVLRHLVLWVGMLGGVLASRASRQIGIDLFQRFSSPRIAYLLALIGAIFTIIVCGWMGYASWIFVASEKAFGSTLYGSIPAWYAQIILPVGFFLIGFQIILNILTGNLTRDNQTAVSDLTTPSPSDDAEGVK